MRIRRLRKIPAHLEITAFINLIVVLVPFLLSTAVFTRLSVIELSLPAKNIGALEQVKPNNLQLEVVVRPDALEVGDRVGGLIERIAARPEGPNVVALATLVQQLKNRFPEQRDATVLAEADTPYETLVQVIDAMRSGRAEQAGKMVRVELFPNVSIGDAPLRKGGAP
jgi:biopolymer transport protein ExbD